MYRLTKQNVWVLSDPHYDHKSLCKGTSTWADKENSCRNFSTVDEMNNSIVDGINKYVKKDDIIYCLGDWSFGKRNSIIYFRERLICKNVNLVLGNHDKIIRLNKSFLEESVFQSISDYQEISVEYKKNSKVVKFVLSHYAHRVWNGHQRGAIHLFGHSHGALDDKIVGRSMDVGMDSAYKRYGEYRPFNIKECVDICNKNIIQKVDHH